MSGFIRELLSVKLYKPSQGKLVRRSTMAGIFIIFAWGAYRFFASGTGTWLMSWVAYFVHFCTPVIKEGEEETASWFAQLPTVLVTNPSFVYLMSGVLLMLGAWLAFRIVNMKRPAEFLISVEGEMTKVSWPSSRELYTTTIVVITTMAILCVFLSIYDYIWRTLFTWMKVL